LKNTIPLPVCVASGLPWSELARVNCYARQREMC
jgi:hypothetical protein